MLRTVTATTPEEMTCLRSAWNRLPSPTMFQSFVWNLTAARVFTELESPYVIYIESDAGAALIPAAIRDSGMALLGEAMFDYRDVLFQGDSIALTSAWESAAERRLDFSGCAVRTDGNIAAWDGFERTSFYGAPSVSRQLITADAFAAEHGRLGRWKRRLEREGVELRSHTGENSPLLREIYRQKGNQPAETGDSLFRDPLKIDFMVEIGKAVGPLCEIFTLETAGTLLASLVTFRDPHVRRFYTVQFDPAWARYSPGMVLIWEVTRRSLAAGLDCDYMTGEHAYKMRFATSVVPMHWVHANAQSLRSLSKRSKTLAA